MADIYPPDFTSEVGQLRVLVSDTEQYPEYAVADGTSAYMFSDEQLGVYLSLFPNIFFAAAACIDALASNEALVSKKIRTEDLATDGAAVANSMRAHAVALRAQGQHELDKDGAVEIIEFQEPVTKWDRFEYGAIGGLNWL